MEGNARESMNGRRSKDDIQEHIEATRKDLRHTIEAIGSSLSVGELVDTGLHALRAGPGEFGANLGRSVRDNPVAVGLLGTGLAWLMLGTDTRKHIRERAEATGQQVRERAGKVREKAGEKAGKVRERAEEGRSVTEASHEKAEEARGAAHRGYARAKGIASDQPLVVAAIGLFAGAAAAAALPKSRTEERAFGERADEAIERVSEVAGDTARGVEEGVREGFTAEAQGPGGTPSAGVGTKEAKPSDPPAPEKGD